MTMKCLKFGTIIVVFLSIVYFYEELYNGKMYRYMEDLPPIICRWQVVRGQVSPAGQEKNMQGKYTARADQGRRSYDVRDPAPSKNRSKLF